jgi:hypothetical protein
VIRCYRPPDFPSRRPMTRARGLYQKTRLVFAFLDKFPFYENYLASLCPAVLAVFGHAHQIRPAFEKGLA